MVLVQFGVTWGDGTDEASALEKAKALISGSGASVGDVETICTGVYQFGVDSKWVRKARRSEHWERSDGGVTVTAEWP